jgi:hypothetical protein
VARQVSTCRKGLEARWSRLRIGKGRGGARREAEGGGQVMKTIDDDGGI